MASNKVVFQNSRGESLSGLLELPEIQTKYFAIFAHCFTCSKNSIAAVHVSRALAKQGIAVLRFDFTGLGNSEGDFSDTNFSSNIDDLIAAATYLEKQYSAPSLLIGHSLGGAAVIAVAQQLACVEAIATIGAPATAAHVTHLFADERQEILENKMARVQLSGQDFIIKQQLIDDLENYNSLEHIKQLGKALLIFHSPVDQVVSIDEAEHIYTAATHPKSFVSLGHADHFLSQSEDAYYVADVLSAWADRYVTVQNVRDNHMHQQDVFTEGTVVVKEYDKKFTREINTIRHHFTSDEPVKLGGADKGPNPYELLLAALGSCTSMTLRMYANHKKLDVQAIEIELHHSQVHAEDCAACENQAVNIDKITQIIKLTGQLNDHERIRMLEIANRCPVHKTLENKILIETKSFD